MAQLKDSQVVGDLRVTGEVIGDVNGDLHGVADTTDKVRYNTFMGSNPWCIAMFDGNSQSPELGNEDRKVYMLEDPNLYYNTDAREGYVGWSFNGEAKLVKNPFTIQISGGTTEGKNKYTFDGETAKTLNIKPYDSNTVLTTSAYGELIIRSLNTNNKVKYYNTNNDTNYPLLLSYYDTNTTSDKTDYARYTPKVFCKPSDGSLTSSGTITAKNGFYGQLNGIANYAYPATEGSPSKPIYWSSTGSPIQCNNTLDVSITGSAQKYDNSFTGDNSIYDSFRYTGITAHINATINAGGALVVDGNKSSCYTTVHGVTQELATVANSQQGSLMNFLGFSPNGNIPTMFQNADTIFIILTGTNTNTVIATNLFDTGFRTGFRKRLILNNCINSAVTISLKNGKNSTSYLTVKGGEITLAKSSASSGTSYDITLPGNSSHIYDIYTPGSSSMIFLQDF